LSNDPVATLAPSGENATLHRRSCRPTEFNSRPLKESQIRTIPSFEALAMRSPFLEKQTPLVPRSVNAVCHMKETICKPFMTSQTRTVLSFEPLTIRIPSGENPTLHTSHSCPRITFSSAPLMASQSFTTVPDPPAIRFPSGEY
jgi:hypothetical protein